MKMRWHWIPFAAMILLIAAAMGIRLWFNAPGIRIFGNEIHADFSEKCFIIDAQTSEVLDETVVTVNGATNRSDQELFDGTMKILGYQNSESGTVTAMMAIEAAENDCWIITHLENCTHQETDINGITKPVEHFCDYSYTYYLYPEAPKQTVVLIESFDQYEPKYAVCAASEEEALARYAEFLKNHP